MAARPVDPRDVRRQVAVRLSRLARAQIRLQQARADLDGELDSVRRRHGRRIGRLRAGAERLRAELEGICREHRRAVLPPGRRSLVMPAGEVGFRRADPALRLAEGVSEEEACRRLRAARLGRLVRVRRSPDKQAARRALREGRLAPARLGRCGLELAPADDLFFCRLGREPASQESPVRRVRRA